MKVKFFYSLLLLIAFAITGAQAQQTAKLTSGGIGYLQYLPQGYSSNSNKYPIVISLHGIKEKGNTLADVGKVANVGLPKYVRLGTQYPFILISPQLKTTMGRWSGDYVMEVLNYVKTTLRVDPSRVYLTGLSLGGGGVWSVATAYPNVFAAIVPICSGYNLTSQACALSNTNLPIWGFHGDGDGIVSEFVTINMVNAVNNCAPRCNPLSKVTIFPSLGHVIWDKVYKETSALSWMLSFTSGGSTTTPPPAAPIAIAGSDKTITLPTSSITLNGSGSDSDGTISSYAWTKKSGGSANLSGAATKDLNISGLVAGSYTFTLTVKDNSGASDSDDVIVTVKSATTTTNAAPIANAGSDRLIALPMSSATISGSGRDSDGTVSSYSWTKISGGSVSINENTSPSLKLSSLIGGSYVFRLTVKDNDGATNVDDVTIIVNRPPVASAGSDRTVTLPLSSISLAGNGTDNDGSISSYQWSKYSGPTLKMTNSTSKTVTLAGLYPGTYIIKLAVEDNNGLVGFDYVSIVVKGTVASITPMSSSNIEIANTLQSETEIVASK